MRTHGLVIRPGSYGTNGSRSFPLYSYRGHRAIDPLAFMLEGKRFTGNCNHDYASEYAIPLPVIDAFGIMITGRDVNNSWSRTEPVLKEELKSFAFGIYYLIGGHSPKDIRICLDGVAELNGKVKMKHLISTGQMAKNKFAPPEAVRVDNFYGQGIDEFGNRIW